MAMIRIPQRLIVSAAGGMLIALAPAATVLVAPNVDPARAVAQGCTDSETEDSYSLQCVPNMVPDFSDQLTEAEVAEPGFNGGGGGAHGGGGGGGHH
ncbi:MAG TPA: hypothetical protein VN888_16835 [Mycobacterium sp.]|nr:hypothetical protein [Mycobacterium sp.]